MSGFLAGRVWRSVKPSLRGCSLKCRRRKRNACLGLRFLKVRSFSELKARQVVVGFVGQAFSLPCVEE